MSRVARHYACVTSVAFCGMCFCYHQEDSIQCFATLISSLFSQAVFAPGDEHSLPGLAWHRHSGCGCRSFDTLERLCLRRAGSGRPGVGRVHNSFSGCTGVYVPASLSIFGIIEISICVCVSVSVFLPVSLYLSLYLSCLWVCLCLYLCLCLALGLNLILGLCLHVSVCVCLCLFLEMRPWLCPISIWSSGSICNPVRVSFCLFLSLSQKKKREAVAPKEQRGVTAYVAHEGRGQYTSDSSHTLFCDVFSRVLKESTTVNDLLTGIRG